MKINKVLSAFQIQNEEKELLKYVANQGFGKIIVLINSSNAMSLNWLKDSQYKIDACLWIGGPGQYGLNSVAKILSGEINPSGRFVDTYSASSLSAPAMENFGAYTWANADMEEGKYNINESVKSRIIENNPILIINMLRFCFLNIKI